MDTKEKTAGNEIAGNVFTGEQDDGEGVTVVLEGASSRCYGNTFRGRQQGAVIQGSVSGNSGGGSDED